MRLKVIFSAVIFLPQFASAQWIELLNKKNLDGWESIGQGIWTVLRDGTLVGQRDLREKANTDPNQAWLYTTRNFREFDLEIEWWTRFGGNSGISLRDSSRARHTFGADADPKRTPARIGHEIQISNGYSDSYPTGSIYLFEKARAGAQIPNDWNRFEIAVRDSSIRVSLNGKVVAEHPGDPGRVRSGPIGLQLHDPQSIVMFRNIRVREISSPSSK
jgi:hypothetical protein